MNFLLDELGQDSTIRNLLSGFHDSRPRLDLSRGGWGGLGPMLALFWKTLDRPILFIGASDERVRSLFSDCTLFTEEARFLPLQEIPPLVDPIVEGERVALLEDLLKPGRHFVLCTLESLLSPVRSPEKLKKETVQLFPGKPVDFRSLLTLLESRQYLRVPRVVSPNEFAVRGAIIDLYPLSSPHPCRIEFQGDVIDNIRTFDSRSQRSIQKKESLELFPPEDKLEANASLIDYFSPETLVIGESIEQWERRVRDFDASAPEQFPTLITERFFDWIEKVALLRMTPAPADHASPWPFSNPENFTHRFTGFIQHARNQLQNDQQILIYSRQASRVREVLAENHLTSIQVFPEPLSEGFILPSRSLHVYTDHELFGRVIGIGGQRKSIPSVPLALEELKEGGIVVHARHGIAIYDGLFPLSIEGKREDYLALSFAGKDKLYVPLEEIVLVERYIGQPGRVPALSPLGGSRWRKTQRGVREAAKEIAQDLVQLYAARSRVPGHSFSPDTPWQSELEEAFPYPETPDQQKAIEETKKDMEEPNPMDRLVLGDVGYGKTEVALRACFKAVMDGKQVALLVPTTILAQQHFDTFGERLGAFPIRLEVLSRFRKKREQLQVLNLLAAGEVDIVIGTHRLLQKDVAFKNLGLLIIDEEQRFGVKHKEILKKLKTQIDVLTLSATPIPRTLYLSLMGVRDISIIETPPEERLPVKTFVAPMEDKVIQQAVQQELRREGQVYYLHNRIEDIQVTAQKLQRFLPHVRIAVAHGRMKPSELEAIMWEFTKGLYDVLLSTTIIENGLDIPNVNTLIVEQAEHYGLAELYQLRGRVGRSDRQAFAYLLTSPRKAMSDLAKKRLTTIEEFSHLGSGYQIALRDLELRGAGNLLGFSQHGHLSDVGFHLYCQILSEEVKKLKGEKPPLLAPSVQLSLPVNAYIPDEYIPSRSEKLAIYRRLAACKTIQESEAIRAELLDRFGEPPREATNLLEMVQLKIICLKRRIYEIKMEDSVARVRFWDGRQELAFPLGEGLAVEVNLHLLKSKLSVIEKGLR